MRLVAVYIKEHFLFSKPKTINLGGKFFYTIIPRKGTENEYNITREENPNFIDGFWGDKISLVSAIVGNNGAGKTYMLKEFNIYDFGSYKETIHIWETEKDSLIVGFYSFQPKVSVPKMFLGENECKYIFHKDSNIEQIHYSPILEYDLGLLKDENRLGHIYSKNKSIVNLRFTSRLSTNELKGFIYNNFLNELEFCEKFKNFSKDESFKFLDYDVKFDYVNDFWGDKRLWYDYKTKRNFNKEHFANLEEKYSDDEKKEIEIYWELYYQFQEINSDGYYIIFFVYYVYYINQYIKDFAKKIIEEINNENVSIISIFDLLIEKLNSIEDEKRELANKLLNLTCCAFSTN